MSEPRLLFVAMPPPDVVAAILDVLRRHDLERLLGRTLFAPANWHQSLSERIRRPTRDDIESLRAVGRQVVAHACTLQYNRIKSSINDSGDIHVTLLGKGRPQAFDALLDALQRRLTDAGHDAIATGVTPHTTLSYRAPALLDKIDIAPMIDWTIDEVLLVIGDGTPYRYEVVDRWPLLPEIDPVVSQAGLF